MSTFAKGTTVGSDKSRAEIERTLMRYGAERFMYANEPEKATVAFQASGIHIKFVLPMPNRGEFVFTPQKRSKRSPDAIDRAFDQAVRERWRALCLVIKAKLEAVESGISIFEEEFMANIVLPDGSTVGQLMIPRVKTAYETGDMPPLLGYQQ